MRGRDKLLEEVAGVPLVRLMAERALAASPEVVVVLPEDGGARQAALGALPVRQVNAAGAKPPMADSIAAGIAALPPGTRAAVILLADMPEIRAEDLTTLLARHRARPRMILRAASEDGRPGNPVLFPAWAFPHLAQLEGDRGAREMLRRHAAEVLLVPLPGRRALTDLDTPEDWAAWRASRVEDDR